MTITHRKWEQDVQLFLAHTLYCQYKIYNFVYFFNLNNNNFQFQEQCNCHVSVSQQVENKRINRFQIEDTDEWLIMNVNFIIHVQCSSAHLLWVQVTAISLIKYNFTLTLRTITAHRFLYFIEWTNHMWSKNKPMMVLLITARFHTS